MSTARQPEATHTVISEEKASLIDTVNNTLFLIEGNTFIKTVQLYLKGARHEINITNDFFKDKGKGALSQAIKDCKDETDPLVPDSEYDEIAVEVVDYNDDSTQQTFEKGIDLCKRLKDKISIYEALTQQLGTEEQFNAIYDKHMNGRNVLDSTIRFKENCLTLIRMAHKYKTDVDLLKLLVIRKLQTLQDIKPAVEEILKKLHPDALKKFQEAETLEKSQEAEKIQELQKIQEADRLKMAAIHETARKLSKVIVERILEGGFPSHLQSGNYDPRFTTRQGAQQGLPTVTKDDVRPAASGLSMRKT